MDYAEGANDGNEEIGNCTTKGEKYSKKVRDQEEAATESHAIADIQSPGLEGAQE